MSVSERGGRDWGAIARAVGGNRTAWHCFREHARAKQSQRKRQKWSAQEDELLRRAVLIFGGNASSRETSTSTSTAKRTSFVVASAEMQWDEIAVWYNAELMRSTDATVRASSIARQRGRQQCYTRWSKSLDPEVQKVTYLLTCATLHTSLNFLTSCVYFCSSYVLTNDAPTLLF